MVPPKKSVKMDLNSFLNDESFGESWAEEEVDLEKINIPIQSGRPQGIAPMESFGGGKGSRLDPSLVPERSERSERMQYDIPNHPPYRAVINNLPWDVQEDGIKAWFEDGLQRPGAVEDVAAPRDYNEPTRLKGFAFVTLCDRDALEASLKFNATKLNERMVYVSVAAPPKGGYHGGDRMGGFDDMDWGAARGSAFQSSNRREEVDIDWSSARGSGFEERRPRREEPNIDWSSARGSGFEERKPRREEPVIDWSSARGSQFTERQPRVERKPRDEPNLDWGVARGAKFGQRSNSRNTTKTQGSATKASGSVEETPKIKKSAYAVLSTEDDDEEAPETEDSTPKPKQDEVAELSQTTAKLSVGDDDDQEWETVGKKSTQ